jgi:hypothetical protein
VKRDTVKRPHETTTMPANRDRLAGILLPTQATHVDC